MANLPRKITLKVWDEEITEKVLAIVIRDLPKSGVSLWTIPNVGQVAVSKKDYRKNEIYDVYINHKRKKL